MRALEPARLRRVRRDEELGLELLAAVWAHDRLVRLGGSLDHVAKLARGAAPADRQHA
jgi:hypothetical protein